MHFILPHFEDTLRKSLINLEKDIQSHLNQAYLGMLLQIFTKNLLLSIRMRDYRIFAENGVIDVCMDEERSPKCSASYFTTKQKYEDQYLGFNNAHKS